MIHSAYFLGNREFKLVKYLLCRFAVQKPLETEPSSLRANVAFNICNMVIYSVMKDQLLHRLEEPDDVIVTLTLVKF